MHKFASFADGIYPGKGNNKGKQYSEIRGYDLIQQWDSFQMGLFKNHAGDHYILTIRGTNKKKDLKACFRLMFAKFPKRLFKFFEALVQIASTVPNNSKIDVVGHSLGGYIAAMIVCGVHMRGAWDKGSPFRCREGANGRVLEDHQMELMFSKVWDRLREGTITINCHAYNPGVKAGGLCGRFERFKKINLWRIMSGAHPMKADNYIPPAEGPRFYFYRIYLDRVSSNLKDALGGDKIKACNAS